MTIRCLVKLAARQALFLVGVLVLAGMPQRSGLAVSQHSVELKPSTPPQQSEAAAAGGGTLAENYCANIADKARDARFAWHSQQLREMTMKLQEQMKLVEVKTQDLKNWVERRDEFLKRGNDSLIDIYSAMKPDAASEQLLNLPEAVAAAVLMKLEPRLSSSILNEMDPVRAGRLATIIAGIGRITKPDGGT